MIKLVMSKKKYITLAIIVAAVAVALILSYGLVPVFKVNGQSFTYANFSKMKHAIRTFNAASGKTPVNGPELIANTLMNLMEQTLLDEVIKKTDSAIYEKADGLVATAIAKNETAATLGEAVKKLYGLSTKDFKKLILLPQAKKDLILKHYEKDNDGLQKLWDEVRLGAKVKIYYPGFYWDGEFVKQK